jgi:long-chain acyl-CoA synthetase
VLAGYKNLVIQANSGMPHWTTIKRFKLISDEVTIDNGMLTPTLKIKRSAVRTRYKDVIAGMYKDDFEAVLVEHDDKGQ